jgi:hypothetical protein
MADRPSRPHASPARTPRRTEHRIVGLRVSRRLGPARIGFRLGLAPSTVHAVLARYGCPRLAHLDGATGVPVRRYERDRPGELVHVDAGKLGNIPDGGGWRVTGKAQGGRNRHATSPGRSPVLGYGYLRLASGCGSGNRKPPASSAGPSPPGSCNRASGLPPVSATTRSRT